MALALTIIQYCSDGDDGDDNLQSTRIVVWFSFFKTLQKPGEVCLIPMFLDKEIEVYSY